MNDFCYGWLASKLDVDACMRLTYPFAEGMGMILKLPRSRFAVLARGDRHSELAPFSVVE